MTCEERQSQRLRECLTDALWSDRVDHTQAIARYHGSGFFGTPPLLAEEVVSLAAHLEAVEPDWRMRWPRLAQLLLGTPGQPWISTAVEMRAGRAAWEIP